MATFRAGKLARKKNGRFQSTAVKSSTENFSGFRKIKSSGSLADAIKYNFSLNAKAKPFYRGGVLLSSVCFPSPLQLSNRWKKTVSGLGSFLYTTLWESFYRRKRGLGDLLVRSEK